MLSNTGFIPLCEAYTDHQYTEAYQSFISLTPDDFPDDVVLDFGDNGFGVLADDVKDVYYSGTQAQWNAIQIANYNAPLRNAAIHYNS